MYKFVFLSYTTSEDEYYHFPKNLLFAMNAVFGPRQQEYCPGVHRANRIFLGVPLQQKY